MENVPTAWQWRVAGTGEKTKMKDKIKTDSCAQESSDKKAKRFLQLRKFRLKDLFLMTYDAVVVTVAFFLALWFRFDGQFTEIPQKFFEAWLEFAPIYAVISVAVFACFHLYQSLWRFASFVELKRIVFSSAILAVVHTVGITVLFGRMPISYYVIGIVIFAAISVPRWKIA